MESIDLFAMRDRYNQQQILLCFNGPISRSLIEEIGNALRNDPQPPLRVLPRSIGAISHSLVANSAHAQRNYMQAEHAHSSSATYVLVTYIAMTPNIRHNTRE